MISRDGDVSPQAGDDARLPRPAEPSIVLDQGGTQAGGRVGDPGIHLPLRNRKGEASEALSAPRCLSVGVIGSYGCWLQRGALTGTRSECVESRNVRGLAQPLLDDLMRRETAWRRRAPGHPEPSAWRNASCVNARTAPHTPIRRRQTFPGVFDVLPPGTVLAVPILRWRMATRRFL